MANFIDNYKSLPQPIKDWLTSDDISTNADALFSHFNLNFEQAGLVSSVFKKWLVSKEIDSKHFTGEIANGLKMDRDRAKLLVQELKKLLILPIKEEFIKAGFDLDGLDVFDMPIVKPSSLSDLKPATPQVIKEPASQNISTIKSEAPQPTQATQPKPAFVFLKQEIKPIIPQKDIKIASPAVNTGINFISKAPVAPQSSVPAAPKAAQIQIGAPIATKQPEIAKTEVPKIKVVHYSQMKSPVQAPAMPNAAPAPASLGDLISKTSMPTGPAQKNPSITPGFTPLRPMAQFPKQQVPAPAQNNTTPTPKPPTPAR